ncbi:MAG: ATP-dependent DNA helicase [Thiobacillaceae bacterium]|nr:ATP-dependent DNA helicase [Thiobacillaceae bacterium]
MDELGAIFAADGPLSRHIPHYRPRPQQLEMARTIQAALVARDRLVVEAGTGTGKTLAYLTPIMLSGAKTILSTASKTLQDQLFQRDIPAVRAALGLPLDVALLKGRANYVCHYHLERALAEARLATREEVAHLQAIARFAAASDSGDRMALGDVPEDSPVWARVVSTRDNCLGAACPYHRGCFVLKARRRALEADLVVINHHLFFADVLLKDEGAGELLPAANAVVFDEAHQLPHTASVFFGEMVSTGMLVDLAHDVRAEAAAAAADFAQLPQAAAAVDKAARDLRLSLGLAGARLPAARALQEKVFQAAYAELEHCMARLQVLLESQAQRSEGLANCLARCQEAAARLERWRVPAAQEGRVRWCEATTHSLLLHATPLDVGSLFARALEDDARAWIFTSATLSVRGDFRHYLGQIGLPQARTALWDSPYDYARQALLYVPAQMPDANSPEYTRACVDAAWPVLRACRGGAFLLFTSLRAMHEAHALVRQRLRDEGLDWPLLLQGSASRSALLAEFRMRGNAVLLGSHSFWEGVDVPGEALTLVVIDRLPFQPPDDPVLAARLEALRRAGHNPFFDHQLPHAVITLKQGAGRLIRHEDDRGVLMICDTRLVDKPYGRRIWQALPPMRRTRALADVLAFFAAAGQSGAGGGRA